jgi:hypothetical protein
MPDNAIRDLIAALKREVRNGTISAATEHHLRREFATIGWGRDPLLHAARLDEEVRRHETEARVLKELRDTAFGGAGRTSSMTVGASASCAPPGQRGHINGVLL